MPTNQELQQLEKLMCLLGDELPEWEVMMHAEQGGSIIYLDLEVDAPTGRFYRGLPIPIGEIAQYHPAMLPTHAHAIAAEARDQLRRARKERLETNVQQKENQTP